MSSTALHRFWYRKLEAAGLVAKGETGSNREMHMHAARHTAGQRLLDATGNLKAVQQLLGHASIQRRGIRTRLGLTTELSRSLLEEFAKESGE